MANEIVGKPPGVGGSETGVAAAMALGTAIEKKKKKKHKYSRGGKIFGEASRGTRKAARRVTKAVAKGLDSFHSRSEKSGGKRRDGALRDMHKNLARSVGSSLRMVSKAPNDLARKLPKRFFINPFRAGLRIFFPFGR